jgi:hypothetical protein
MATIVDMPYGASLEIPTEMLATFMKTMAASKVIEKNYASGGYRYVRSGKTLDIGVIIDAAVEEPPVPAETDETAQND